MGFSHNFVVALHHWPSRRFPYHRPRRDARCPDSRSSHCSGQADSAVHWDVTCNALGQGVILNDGCVLFFSSRQLMNPLALQTAVLCGQPYLVDKWVPGLITNFDVVFESTQQHIEALNENPNLYKKKKRLRRRIAGLENLDQPPDVVFLFNTRECPGVFYVHDFCLLLSVVCNVPCVPGYSRIDAGKRSADWRRRYRLRPHEHRLPDSLQ